MNLSNQIVKVQKIYRKKASGMVAHSGLKLTWVDDTVLVFHNTPNKGSHISTYDEFSEGQLVIGHRIYAVTAQLRARLEGLVISNKKYSVFGFNCEQAASFVTTGVAKSPQVRATIGGGLIVGLFAKLLGSSNKESLGYAVIGAGAGLVACKSKLV